MNTEATWCCRCSTLSILSTNSYTVFRWFSSLDQLGNKGNMPLSSSRVLSNLICDFSFSLPINKPLNAPFTVPRMLLDVAESSNANTPSYKTLNSSFPGNNENGVNEINRRFYDEITRLVQFLILGVFCRHLLKFCHVVGTFLKLMACIVSRLEKNTHSMLALW